ncbi:MAG: hypothetical protein OXD40_01250, partial [bacterium]|nr:hypothetical protein [bacterium]
MTCARREAAAHKPALSTSAPSIPAESPHRPEPRSGRARLSLLLPALALLLGALSPWAAAPAGAQTVTLVTNFNQHKSSASPHNPNRRPVAQGFTTGGAYPYFLSSIEVIARSSTTAGGRANLRAELWSASGNVPGAKIADLTVPANAGADRTYTERLNSRQSQTVTHSVSQHGQFVSFGAPANTRLEPNTTYFLVVYGASGDFYLALDFARLNLGEDQISLPGWSIANSIARGTTTIPATSNFSVLGNTSLKIKVTGRSAATATVSLSTSPSQVWEGGKVRVDATLSRALPHAVDIPITVKPCPSGSWCARFANPSIRIPAGFTSGNLRVPVPGQSNRFSGIQTVRDTNADNEEITVALRSNLPANVTAGPTASRTVRILDMDGYAMTLTADRQPSEKGEDVTVTVDLGRLAPDGFFVVIEGLPAGTASYGVGQRVP